VLLALEALPESLVSPDSIGSELPGQGLMAQQPVEEVLPRAAQRILSTSMRTRIGTANTENTDKSREMLQALCPGFT
jgi:hypothetical protein